MYVDEFTDALHKMLPPPPDQNIHSSAGTLAINQEETNFMLEVLLKGTREKHNLSQMQVAVLRQQGTKILEGYRQLHEAR